MSDTIIETLIGEYTPAQTLQIRREEKRAGHRVNIKPHYGRKVKIEIIEPDRTIQARYSVKQLN